VPTSTVRYDGIVHDFMMLDSLRDTGRASEPIELGHDKLVPGATRCERVGESRARTTGPRETVVDVDAVGFDAEGWEGRRVGR
jgi:hypothetical protein